MCTHCGCSSEKARLVSPGANTSAEVVALARDPATLKLEHALLAGNDAIAADNRAHFDAHRSVCINLMGTPGAGKTALLEALLRRGSLNKRPLAVLEGDQQSSNDAQRIVDAGGNALQINTGTGCHLDAEMIRSGVAALGLANNSLLFIENVGNLVCPALFDLGENLRIAMMAVTDGEDKPQKYPHMFSQCDLVLINKADLLPYIDVNIDRIEHDIGHLNPGCAVITVSAKTGQGLDAVEAWLQQHSSHG
ncbi:hydrogenase nickel incorporation protein HypB [Aestuariibacter halophilus]|uniref:Hydrogenase maturation factor HypB n=1 Tax=Fluctibacter halophilus TaxID=226011 RepID=A0ABS8G8R3_9ALTE|nr:hydrogenase nickel incorporation protein HypB [Aestuariibacter halophilus]MCC2615586.1 hydrogenase nickel incorporation protein HypB [Aestuariibacter halophilus]